MRMGQGDTTVKEPVIPFGHSKSLDCLCIPSPRSSSSQATLAAQNGQCNQGREPFQAGVLSNSWRGLGGPRAASPPTPAALRIEA